MDRIEFKSFHFETKADQAGDGATFEGVVACYNNVDNGGDMFVPGCFDDYIEFFKSDGVIRDEHRTTIGKVLDASSTPVGLFLKGAILPTAAGRDVSILVKGGAIKRLSIGSRNSGRWVDDPEEVKAIWTKAGYTPSEDDLIRAGCGVRVIERSKPYECSTTWLPMNEGTAITSVKSGDDARAATSFDQHTTDALDTLGEWATRAEAIRELRHKEGRGLSQKAQARIGQAIDRLTTLRTDTPATSPGVDPKADRDLEDEITRTLARCNGVKV